MTKTSLFAAMLLVTAAGAAEAGGQPGTVGVGAEYQLSGAGGASVNYDGGPWHAGGFLSFFDPGAGDSSWELGGRFYYHVHETTTSDFGIGGSLGIISTPDGAGDTATLVYLEPGVQMRAFITANVALSAEAGIIIGLQDADGVTITGGTPAGGDPNFGVGAGIGLHYYFFTAGQ